MTNLNRCTKTDTDTPLHSQNAVKMGRVWCQNVEEYRFWHRNCRKNDMLIGWIGRKTRLKFLKKMKILNRCTKTDTKHTITQSKCSQNGRVWCQNVEEHRFWHRKGVKNDMVLCKIQRKMILNFFEENDKFEQMHKNSHRHTITQSKCSQNGPCLVSKCREWAVLA
jgi:hypothetical protein